MAAPSSTLKAALVVSLLAHAVLLAWGRWSLTPTPSVAAGGMRVDLRGGRPAADAMPREALAAPLSRQVSPKTPSRLPERPAPILAVPGATAQVAAAAARPPAPAEATPERRGDGEGHAGAAASPAASGGERGVAAPAREGASGDALRQYRLALALALEARRFKRYPRLARERGWEGTVEVVVLVGGPAGLAGTVQLQRSSGYGLLDDQGLEMLNRALAATPLPEALRGRELRLVLPIEFKLEE